MATQHSQTTTDHEEIRRWVEERGAGRPPSRAPSAVMKKREFSGSIFPGRRRMNPWEDIDWDTFFSKFEESELAFVYQDETAEGQESRFGRFIRR